jgi:hypothetical protein
MNLKKIGKVFTSKFGGTRPSSYKKKNLPGLGLTKVEKHWSRVLNCSMPAVAVSVQVMLSDVSLYS